MAKTSDDLMKFGGDLAVITTTALPTMLLGNWAMRKMGLSIPMRAVVAATLPPIAGFGVAYVGAPRAGIGVAVGGFLMSSLYVKAEIQNRGMLQLADSRAALATGATGTGATIGSPTVVRNADGSTTTTTLNADGSRTVVQLSASGTSTTTTINADGTTRAAAAGLGIPRGARGF